MRPETAYWWANSVERSRANTYRSNLKRLYGLTQEEYDAVVEKHRNRCAICGVAQKIALLGLQTGIGGFRDDEALLKKAIEYLKISKME